MAASDDLQRIKLQVLYLAHGLLGPFDASPPPPGPQALFAQDEAAGSISVDGDHDMLATASYLPTSGSILLTGRADPAPHLNRLLSKQEVQLRSMPLDMAHCVEQ